jgi:ABC-type Fe3+/spermidine/putrescine transport system ATPase subunit
VSFSYGVADVSLTVPPGSFFVLLGESGCGKTTLLKLLGGYLLPATGSVWLEGREITRLPPERRGIGTVFQSYALFPHLTARRNVSFGLEVRGVRGDELERRVTAALDRVSLPADARDRRPAALSGGQQQRVALARALVIEPRLLLLDEPLANLDRRLRDQVRGELKTGVTTLLVTHDPEDALSLADAIGVMAAGRLLQVGPPREVYERPASGYVARLLGEANFLPGGVMVRPERVRLVAGDEPVRAVRYCGSRAIVDVGGVLVEVDARAAPRVGERAGVEVPAEARHVLPEGV